MWFGLLLSTVVVTLCNAELKFYDGLVNTRAQTATYLTNAATKNLVTLEVKNFGDKSADIYLVSIPKALHENLAFLSATDSDSGDELGTRLESRVIFTASQRDSLPVDPDDNVYYSLPLPKTLLPDEGATSVEIKLTMAYIHQLPPLPAEIKKTSKVNVVYDGNRYFYSPYHTKKLGVKYTLASDKIKSFTKPVASQSDKKLTYGPYTDLESFATSDVRFHFQFNQPYLTMTDVQRDIEISHWGNVRVEDSYQMKHDGPRLKGAYEVGVYDRIGMFGSSDPASLHELRATLPRGAKHVYYTDRIGNISTSHFRTAKTVSYLEVKPRYPLYGGWKTDFVIGYDVPSEDLISIDPETRLHTLNVSFGIPFKEPVVDVMTTSIALPEGAYDVEVISPYPIEQEPMGHRFTYLDTVLGGGRPLLIFHKRNVINMHSDYFQIQYKYRKNQIYFKPSLMITGFFAFFMTIFFLRRINLSLDTDEEKVLRQQHAKNRSGIDQARVVPGVMTAEALLDDVDTSGSVSEILYSLNEAKRLAGEMGEDDLVKKIKKAVKKVGKNKDGSKDKIVNIVSDLKSIVS